MESSCCLFLLMHLFGFFLSQQLSCSLISLRFFFTEDSLIKGQVSKVTVNSTSILSTGFSLDSIYIFYAQGNLVKGPLKVSYYLGFYALLYLHGSGSRLLQGAAFLQASLCFSTFMSLAQEHHPRRCFISFSLRFFIRLSIGKTTSRSNM